MAAEVSERRTPAARPGRVARVRRWWGRALGSEGHERTTVLLIARWPALGSQGSQVATAAFFAFSTYVSATSALDKVTQLGQIILLVLIGCGVGVVVNVTVLPPLRYRSAEHGIRTLAHALCDLVSGVCTALRERGLDKWSADEDRYRYGAFLVGYAEFLESPSRITRVFADLDEDRLGDQVRRFDELADRAQNCRRQLADL